MWGQPLLAVSGARAFQLSAERRGLPADEVSDWSSGFGFVRCQPRADD